MEKLITKARKGGLQNRRLIIARLNNIDAAAILVDVIAPQIKRDSGYLRIEQAGYRRGDNAEMGTISFVDEIDYDFEPNEADKAAKTTKKTSEASAKATEAKKSAKKEDK